MCSFFTLAKIIPYSRQIQFHAKKQRANTTSTVRQANSTRGEPTAKNTSRLGTQDAFLEERTSHSTTHGNVACSRTADGSSVKGLVATQAVVRSMEIFLGEAGVLAML
ncbi:MAG: hypothetical protein FWB93_05180 [Oscillospiraceae bacterium]|nr:hypothetical protein [Oscillospiraceae bacterium]